LLIKLSIGDVCEGELSPGNEGKTEIEDTVAGFGEAGRELHDSFSVRVTGHLSGTPCRNAKKKPVDKSTG